MSETKFIYSLIDPITEQVRYIGCCSNPTERLYDHCKNKNQKDKYEWVKSLRPLKLRPIIEIIETVNSNNWIFWEQHYISLYKSWGFALFNKSIGGNSATGVRHSEEFKQNRRNFRHTNEAKERIKKNNPKIWLGKKRSQETIDKIRRANTGKKQSEHTIELRRKKAIGRVVWWQDKISKSLTGKKLSDAHKKRLSECHTRKKTVLQFDLNGVFIKEWESINMAKNSLDLKNISNISMCCKGTGGRKSAYGFIWKFKNK